MRKEHISEDGFQRAALKNCMEIRRFDKVVLSGTINLVRGYLVKAESYAHPSERVIFFDFEEALEHASMKTDSIVKYYPEGLSTAKVHFYCPILRKKIAYIRKRLRGEMRQSKRGYEYSVQYPILATTFEEAYTEVLRSLMALGHVKDTMIIFKTTEGAVCNEERTIGN